MATKQSTHISLVRPTIIAVVQLFLGSVLLSIAFGFMIFSLALSLFTQDIGFISLILEFLGMSLGILFIIRGVRSLILLSRCRRIVRLMADQNRASIKFLCDGLRLGEPIVLKSIQSITKRNYIYGAYLDSDRNEFVLARDKTMEPVKTGDKEVDTMLNAAYAERSKLRFLTKSVKNAEIALSLKDLVRIVTEVVVFLEEHPNKVRSMHQFLTYYIPTTVKLLQNYNELEKQQVKGENVTEAMKKIEESLPGIVSAFRRELDNLFFDKTMDISTEVEVLTSLLQQQELNR